MLIWSLYSNGAVTCASGASSLVWVSTAVAQEWLGAERIYVLPQVGRGSVAQRGDFLFDSVLL